MDTRVTKAAIAEGAFLEPTLFYESARAGMQDFLADALKDKSGGVLLPAFIGQSPREGSGVYDPIRTLNLRASFYSLDSELQVDMSDLQKRLQTGDFSILVVIHYFGRSERHILEIRKLAERHNVILVEDLAHAFFSAMHGAVCGSQGQVCLYSLHKMFPIPNGGMITYRDQSLIRGQRQTRPELPGVIQSYNWSAISRARRNNFKLLTEKLLALPEYKTDFLLFWQDLSSGDVPQSLPVRILSGNRDEIYRRMNDEGYGMVSLYHTLIDEVVDTHTDLLLISQEIINFPVHQDVSRECINPMVQAFRTHLNS